ncbi:hypothetical protein ACOME3_004144 [Neoechinorhynchus agilis]
MNPNQAYNYSDNPNVYDDVQLNHQSQEYALSQHPQTVRTYYAGQNCYNCGTYGTSWDPVSYQHAQYYHTSENYVCQQQPEHNSTVYETTIPTAQSIGSVQRENLSSIERKSKHRDVERRRRNKIRDATFKIRSVLPNCSQRANIGEVLEATLNYVKVTKMTNTLTKMLFGNSITANEEHFWIHCEDSVFEESINQVEQLFPGVSFQFGLTPQSIHRQRTSMKSKRMRMEGGDLSPDKPSKKRMRF